MIKTVNLKKHFHIGRNQTLHAVDGISLTIAENEILGLVGAAEIHRQRPPAVFD